MIEQQKQRIEMEITKQLDDLDRNVLRKMQADMHDCAARCCKDTVSSMDTVQQCVERCSVPAQRAQQHVETEINSFNSRLQRCVMDCNDTIKDKMGPNPSEGDIAKYTAEFERCAIKCVDKHVAILPNMFASMRKVLQSRSSS